MFGNKIEILNKLIEPFVDFDVKTITDYWITENGKEFKMYIPYDRIESIEMNLDTFDGSKLQYEFAFATLIIAPDAQYAIDIINKYKTENMEKVTPWNLIPGRKLYIVRVTPGSRQAHLEENVILESPKRRTVGVFAKVRTKSSFNPIKTFEYDISLKDAGIIENEYNEHKSFFSKAQAEAYLAIFKRY